MRSRHPAALLAWAALDLVAFGTAALADLSGPASLPPSGYEGLQFVDARGCLFLRAGFGAQTVWVPMVDDSKSQICNMAPTFGGAAAPAPVAAPAPAPNPAPAPVPVAAPPVQLAAAAAPVAAQPVQTQRVAARPVMLPPPKGWKFAWKDDRLNPMRGYGTAEGQAQMDALWTREVPANLVPQAAPPQVVYLTAAEAAAVARPPVTRISTMSAPTAKPELLPKPAAGAKLYVQIGSFAVPANAASATSQIAALGLPAATSQAKALQIVFAGPFTDKASAAEALARLRAAGFADAFIR